MEATLETIRQITYECIDYIEENAVWLGIVGVAVLILMLLFGGLAAASRSRKQTKFPRQKKRKLLLEKTNSFAPSASQPDNFCSISSDEGETTIISLNPSNCSLASWTMRYCSGA